MVQPKKTIPLRVPNFNYLGDVNLPLHAKVRQVLRERTLLDFAHGQQFHSERELIGILGVSQPTVRRALSDLVGEGYLMADARRGYFVRHYSETRYVGLVQPMGNEHPYGNEAAEYFAQCRDQGIALNLYGLHKNDTANDVMKMIQHKPTEERIIMTNHTLELTRQLGSLLRRDGYRHVLVGPRPPGFTGSSVYRDLEHEVTLVMDYLVGLGHERIVFMVNEPERLVITNRRAQIVAAELKKRGLKHSSLVHCKTKNWENSYTAAYRKTRELLLSKPWPTAIIPLSGVGSWAVLRYAVEHRIDVPGELSILSFDPTVNAELLSVPMTELTVPLREYAQKALELLWVDSPIPAHKTIETALVVRQSCAPPAVGT